MLANFHFSRCALLTLIPSQATPTLEGGNFVGAIASAAFILCFFAAVAGPLLTLRQTGVALLVAIPAALLIMAFCFLLQLGLGCSILPPSVGACL